MLKGGAFLMSMIVGGFSAAVIDMHRQFFLGALVGLFFLLVAGGLGLVVCYIFGSIIEKFQGE